MPPTLKLKVWSILVSSCVSVCWFKISSQNFMYGFLMVGWFQMLTIPVNNFSVMLGATASWVLSYKLKTWLADRG